jgi:hypothetical protein
MVKTMDNVQENNFIINNRPLSETLRGIFILAVTIYYFYNEI